MKYKIIPTDTKISPLVTAYQKLQNTLQTIDMNKDQNYSKMITSLIEFQILSNIKRVEHKSATLLLNLNAYLGEKIDLILLLVIETELDRIANLWVSIKLFLISLQGNSPSKVKILLKHLQAEHL